MMKIRPCWMIAVMLSTGACGTGRYADQVHVQTLSQGDQQAALGVRLFDQSMQPPPPRQILGEVQAVSCQNKMWSAPATKGDALSQLRVKALRLGATAVTGVTYSERGQTYKPNCWESVIVSGTAVIL